MIRMVKPRLYLTALLFFLSGIAAAEFIPHAPDGAPYHIAVGNDKLADFFGPENFDKRFVSAHRGGPKPGFPENAIETFAEATRYGPMLIEMDARKTKDGVLVLMHDRRLDRTTTGSGLVSKQEWRALRSLTLVDNAGAVTPYKIPTLAAALNWGRDKVIFMLDIKRGVTASDVVGSVAAADAFHYVVFIARSLEEGIAIQQMNAQAVVNVYASDADNLIKVVESRLDKDRALVWTGLKVAGTAFYQSVHAAGMMIAMGTLGFDKNALDEQFARQGNTKGYQTIFQKGVHIISTDRYWAAVTALK